MSDNTIPSKPKLDHPLTQQDRYDAVVWAIWFSAKSYVPPENDKPIMAFIDVRDTAHAVVSMLNDLDLIPSLPIEDSSGT